MIAFLNWLDGVLWGVPLIALMILTGLYFTVRSGFFQFRHFGWIMKRTGGKLFQKEDKASEGKGMLSSFEAISTAIGGTVGFGNIAGVATAVAAGGPGAIMWMWLSSLLGMILKQVEVTLGCYYRHTNEKGEYYGGPTYYMECGLGEDPDSENLRSLLSDLLHGVRTWRGAPLGQAVADPGAHLRHRYFLHLLRNLFQPDRISGRSRCVRY